MSFSATASRFDPMPAVEPSEPATSAARNRRVPSLGGTGTPTRTSCSSNAPRAGSGVDAITRSSSRNSSAVAAEPAAPAFATIRTSTVSPPSAPPGASSRAIAASGLAVALTTRTAEPRGSRAMRSGSSSIPSVTSTSGRPAAVAASTNEPTRDATSDGTVGTVSMRSESPKRMTRSAPAERSESTTARALVHCAESPPARQLAETSRPTQGARGREGPSGASSSSATIRVPAKARNAKTVAAGAAGRTRYARAARASPAARAKIQESMRRATAKSTRGALNQLWVRSRSAGARATRAATISRSDRARHQPACRARRRSRRECARRARGRRPSAAVRRSPAARGAGPAALR